MTLLKGAYVHGSEWSDVWTPWIEKVGSKPNIFLTYKEFGDRLIKPKEETLLKQLEITPMVTIEPHEASLASIVEGKWDSYLQEQRKLLIDFGSKVFIRFAHEMNGDWYPWCGNPTMYRKAFRHVTEMLSAASNARFVWCPNTNDSDKYPFTSYYPGNQYVHLFGLDTYNWGRPWRGLPDLLRSSYAEMAKMNPNKKIIVCETACVESVDKPGWIHNAYRNTQTKLPRVSGIIWFDLSIPPNDWRVDSSPASLKAYREVIQ